MKIRVYQQRVAAGPGAPSERVQEVAGMFGLGLDADRRVTVVPEASVPLRPGQIVFVTGASGGGKSTLLRCLHDGVVAEHPACPVLGFVDAADTHRGPLIDAFDALPLDAALRVLSLAGLNDAFVMLRRPGELSDGQRYRFGLARVMAEVETHGGSSVPAGAGVEPRAVILADEFGATLDRLTARVIARNIRKWVSRSGVCLVAATTHDDLLEALCPDVLIEQHLGGRMELVERREATSTTGRAPAAP